MASSKKLNKKSDKKTKKTIVSKKVTQNVSRQKGIKKNTTARLIIVLALIFIIGVVITSTIYINYRVIDYIKIDTSVKVVDYLVAGLNTDNSSLIFGKTYHGGGGIRYFDITSQERSLVNIRASGNIANFLSFSNSSFIIAPGENVTITAYLNVPKTTLPGNYTGKVHVYFLKP